MCKNVYITCSVYLIMYKDFYFEQFDTVCIQETEEDNIVYL
jgi:hypothetical protein